MKILSSQLYTPYQSAKNSKNNKAATINVPALSSMALNSTSQYNPLKVPFYGLVEPSKSDTDKITYADYQNSKKYLKTALRAIPSYNMSNSLNDFDLKKLNGIQYGIEVFEGISMKDIAFIYDKFNEISVNRGCHNKCLHCYVNAKPPSYTENVNHISKMSFEDYSSLMDGFSELNKRIGFNVIKGARNHHIALFRDSDCINIELFDKNGKAHDFPEINDMCYDSTARVGLFDTAGWTPKDKKLQERAERIVEYFSDRNNINKVFQVNISLNPFHGLYAKSIQYKEAGNEVAAKKMRDLYIDRMANVLFTFTPLLKYDNFTFISRIADEDNPVSEDYKKSAHILLLSEILDKLEDKYIKDLNSDKKYIKNKKQLDFSISKYTNKIDELNHSPITLIGRAQGLITERVAAGYNLKMNDITKSERLDRINTNLKNSATYRLNIDANGKVFLINPYLCVPSELQLNFQNKNKETEQFPDLIEDYTVTKKMIEEAY